MAEPKRPGLRLGVEREGRYAGTPTLVVLGGVPWKVLKDALEAHRPDHVFWEVAFGQRPWRHVRQLLGGGYPVTVEVSDPRAVPRDIAAHENVELMVCLGAEWGLVDSLKINHGGFHVSWTVVGHWHRTSPRDYEGDVEVWGE